MVEARVTRIIGVPSFFLKLLVICKNEKRLLPGIKAIIVGLGPLIPEVKKTFDLLKINVCHTYGATENVWTLAMEEFGEPSANPRNRGLAGLKYKVLDANGDEIEGGEIRRGPLCVSGPSVMSGYENLEKETKLKIRGTWLYTGDIAQLEGKDETLNITYLARREDYLERQGTPVSLSEIDRVVKKIRGIQDAGAFVLSRAVNINERVIAVAIVKATGSTVSEATILEACKTELSAHLTPDKIIFSDEIPRDLGGNVLGNRLRGLFAGAAG
jgi:acyl-CoA synthetase (AMP-forming)/AMP-acid ligase II